MAAKETNNGKKGGTLKGKPHNDKHGNPIGGIKAIVTDTNQIVELEGGETIINKEASKLHWKELSKINQSAGNGVPILPPDEVMADVEDYKERGGAVSEFNPNNLPYKWLMAYAAKIKIEYPELWDLNNSELGNEAFINLLRVEKRGYWLPEEQWFYETWRLFCDSHKIKTLTELKISSIINHLKWCNVVGKSWAQMKARIESEIKNRGLVAKKCSGGIMEKGGTLTNEAARERLIRDLVDYDGNDFHVNDKLFEFILMIDLKEAKKPIQVIYDALEGYSGDGFYVTDGMLALLRQNYDVFKKGGKITNPEELKMGIEEETEHAETLRKLYSHEITPKQGLEEIAKTHLEKDDHYYSIAKKEGFRDGGKIATVMSEFNKGLLRSSSGDLVTDPKQAIAIALNEQRRHEQKMDLGGKVNCRCGNSWLKAEKDTYKCDVCGNNNLVRTDMINNENTVKIEKVDKMEKSNIFYNSDIFTSIGDYILGGFNAEELNGIEVVGDSFALSFPKLELIFEDRIKRLIEGFKKEIRLNILKTGRDASEIDFEKEITDEFQNLFQTYLGVSVIDQETDSLVNLIVGDSSYTTWTDRIRKRVDEFRNRLTAVKTDVNSQTDSSSSISVADAENNTYCATLEQLLESLSNINEANEI